jgi:hypothetical protein
MSGEERAERLLSQLHEWAMQAVELPRPERETFILGVADKHYEDALRNGLTEQQAEAWRASVGEWLGALVDVIETSGGAEGGHA